MIKKIKHRLKKRVSDRKLLRELLANAPSAFDKANISWVAPEGPEHERGKVWKITSLFLVVSLIALALYSRVWTFALAIGVFSFVYYFLHYRKPVKRQEIVISDIGIKLGSKKIPFSRIKAFWLIYEPPFTKTLNLRVSDDLFGEITVQLEEMDPSLIREFLIDKIPEIEGKKETISDILVKLFKL